MSRDPFVSGFIAIIIMTILFIGIFTIDFIIQRHGMKLACEEEGGVLSGNFDCRKGNEFYEIYQTNEWSIFDYTVNKYPKRGGDEKIKWIHYQSHSGWSESSERFRY